MRRTSLWVLGITFFNVFLPVSASAGQVAYNFSGLTYEWQGSPQWEITGSFTFDERDLIAEVDLIDKIVSWEFTWTNGSEVYSLSSASAVINDDPDVYINTGMPVFEVDTSGQITELAFEALEALGNRTTVVALFPEGAGFGLVSPLGQTNVARGVLESLQAPR